jgi:predicted  nucleic acid-binding Zn-ribbon protein
MAGGATILSGVSTEVLLNTIRERVELRGSELIAEQRDAESLRTAVEEAEARQKSAEEALVIARQSLDQQSKRIAELAAERDEARTQLENVLAKLAAGSTGLLTTTCGAEPGTGCRNKQPVSVAGVYVFRCLSCLVRRTRELERRVEDAEKGRAGAQRALNESKNEVKALQSRLTENADAIEKLQTALAAADRAQEERNAAYLAALPPLPEETKHLCGAADPRGGYSCEKPKGHPRVTGHAASGAFGGNLLIPSVSWADAEYSAAVKAQEDAAAELLHAAQAGVQASGVTEAYRAAYQRVAALTREGV